MLTVKNMWYYIPNIVDYFRYILIFICSLFVFDDSPLTVIFDISNYHYYLAGFFIFFSYLLDQIDGKLARKYKQCSTFGLMLDYCIDTITTCFLYAVLCRLYPFITIYALIHISMEIFGCVFSVANTVNGYYWKSSNSSVLFKFYMENGGIMEKVTYTCYSLFLILQYMYYYNKSNVIVIMSKIIFIPSVMYLFCSASILYEGIVNWKEKNQNI